MYNALNTNPNWIEDFLKSSLRICGRFLDESRFGINLPPRFSWTLWLPCEGRKPGVGAESGADTSAAWNRGADMGSAQRSGAGGASTQEQGSLAGVLGLTKWVGPWGQVGLVLGRWVGWHGRRKEEKKKIESGLAGEWGPRRCLGFETLYYFQTFYNLETNSNSNQIWNLNDSNSNINLIANNQYKGKMQAAWNATSKYL
jgi:hypothetical protein